MRTQSPPPYSNKTKNGTDQVYADLTSYEREAIAQMEVKLGILSDTQGFYPTAHLLFVNLRKQLDIEPRLLMLRTGDHSVGFYRADERGELQC